MSSATLRASILLLPLVAFADELASGIAVVAAPDVEDAHGVCHADYALWIFALPMLMASLIEAPIALWSDRLDRRRLLARSLLVFALTLGLCALANEAWLLSLALALSGAASGVSCASAQSQLIASHPGGAARAMVRWTVLASAGDVVAPLVVSGVLALGGSYRECFWLVAVMVGLQWVVTRRGAPHPAPLPKGEGGDADAETERWRALFGTPRLWALLLATATCALLDELVIALAALRLTRDLHASEALAAASLTLFSLGSLLGALVTDALVARAGVRRVLTGSSVLSLVSLAGLVLAETPALAVAWLFVLGVSAAPHYPLLKAAAYEAAPGRPGLVNAIAQLLVVFDIALPLGLGMVATHWGLAVALALLALQGLAVLFAAAHLLTKPGSPR